MPPPLAATTAPEVPASVREKAKCKHCGGAHLHAQYGKFGYFFRCVDCTENTPMTLTCPTCKGKAKARKSGPKFFHECEKCGRSELYHVNQSLADMDEYLVSRRPT